MTDPDHRLLCRVYGPAPAFTHSLREPLSDYAFWRDRMADRRGEVVFGLLDECGRMTLTRMAEYPRGIYRVPSGGIRPGEAVIDALYREVSEELGRPFDVLRYAGLIEFEFHGPGPAVRFPSHCFLLCERWGPEGPGVAAGDTGGEVDAVLAATPSELASMIARLESIRGEWADWGRYRAAAGRLVARDWEAWRDAGGESAFRADEIVDASLPVHEQMACYPRDEPPRRCELTSRSSGSPGPGWLVTQWTLNAHAGTHVDAPAHLLPGGLTVDRLPPASLSGTALVVDCRRAVASGRPASNSDFPPEEALRGRIVLLKLGLGREIAGGRYDPEIPVLDAGGARYLVASGARAVGVESLSIDSRESGYTVHLILLEAGLPVIEGLDLSAAEPGEWHLEALPVRLTGAEAAPCRAVLLRRAVPLSHADHTAAGGPTA